MASVSEELSVFYDYLINKYHIDVPLYVEIHDRDVEMFEEDGRFYYAQIQEGYPYIGILIATRSPHSPLLLLAHEFCHLLQMYKWYTWHEGMAHPPQDHELEIEARSFASSEVEAYRCP